VVPLRFRLAHFAGLVAVVLVVAGTAAAEHGLYGYLAPS